MEGRSINGAFRRCSSGRAQAGTGFSYGTSVSSEKQPCAGAGGCRKGGCTGSVSIVPLRLSVDLNDEATLDIEPKGFLGCTDGAVVVTVASNAVGRQAVTAGAAARGTGVGQQPLPMGIASSVVLVLGELGLVISLQRSTARPKSLSRFCVCLNCTANGSLLKRRSGRPPATGTESRSGFHAAASGGGAGKLFHESSTASGARSGQYAAVRSR